MVILVEPLLQLPVTDTVYVVVISGVASGLEQFEQLKVVAGLHKYVNELSTCNEVVSPRHIVEYVAVTAGGETIGCVTVTVTLAVPVMQLPDTVIVYVVVVAGVATGLGQFVQLKPVAGLHVKLLPLFTCKVVESPVQIVSDAAVAIGVEVPPEKCAIMLSVVVSRNDIEESLILGVGVWF